MSTASSPLSPTQIGHFLPLSALSGLRHRRFTVEEYENLVRNGTITENDRCELIRGVITDKMGIGDLHTACVKRLLRLFSSVVGNRGLVSIQDPVALADSVPEPDCAILKYRADFYCNTKPQPSDVLLMIEVADSSLEYDRGVKLALYAESGIADYWIANVVDSAVEIHRQPEAAGTYSEHRILRRGETLSPLAWPDITLSVDDILGPPSKA